MLGKASKEERVELARKIVNDYWASTVFSTPSEFKEKIVGLKLNKSEIADLRDELPFVQVGTTADRVRGTNRLLKRLEK